MNIPAITRRNVAHKLGLSALFFLSNQLLAKTIRPTPFQVEGPFHPIQDQFDKDLDLTVIKGSNDRAIGEVIHVHGQVLDTDKRPVANATVDIWQANHNGRYAHPGDKNTAPLDPGFQGWGLLKTDNQGRYNIKTIKPGPYPLTALGGQGWRCRHIHFKVSHPERQSLTTQMYFRGDPLIDQDMEIRKVPSKDRDLLIADAKVDEISGRAQYRFDIILSTS